MFLSLYVQFMSRIEEMKAAETDETGATAVEYGMIVALIAAVCVAIITTLGTNIRDAFTLISNAI